MYVDEITLKIGYENVGGQIVWVTNMPGNGRKRQQTPICKWSIYTVFRVLEIVKYTGDVSG